jgi:K+-sensing histidine kinase KdpD
VRERTEELTRVNQELELARQVAENANISKTRFLAAASHDILQPLNAARLYASTLNETDMPPDATKFARNIDRSLEAVEDILGALLDISRLDAGAMKPEPSVFALQELFEQLQVEFGPAAAENGLSLRFVKTSVMVRSDRKLLKRLLQNLVSNAVKYTRSGGVAIGMRRDGRIRVAVYDTGIGMGRREQRQVFDEFKRLDDGARTAGGLGSVCRLSIASPRSRPLGGHHLAAWLGVMLQRDRAACGARQRGDAAMAVQSAAKTRQTGRAHQTDLTGVIVCCIDNEPTILEGMKRPALALGRGGDNRGHGR